MRTCVNKTKARTRSRILPPRLTKSGGRRFSVRKALNGDSPKPVIKLDEPVQPVRDTEVVQPERMPYDGNTAFNLYLREVGQTSS